MNNLSERGIKILASMGLILTTMIWGFAFVVMKNSVDVIPSGGPLFHVRGTARPVVP